MSNQNIYQAKVFPIANEQLNYKSVRKQGVEELKKCLQTAAIPCDPAAIERDLWQRALLSYKQELKKTVSAICEGPGGPSMNGNSGPAMGGPGGYGGYGMTNGPMGGNPYGQGMKKEMNQSRPCDPQGHMYQQPQWGGMPPQQGGNHGYPNRPGGMNGQGTTPTGTSSVLESLINQPQQYPGHHNSVGAPGPDRNAAAANRGGAGPGGPGGPGVPGGPGGPGAQRGPNGMPNGNQGVMSVEDQQIYSSKLRNMRGSCDSLRTRARQCRQEGNQEAAHKLEVMLSVLEGKRVVSLEYLNHLETWIARKQDFLNINPMAPNPNHMEMNDPVMNGDHVMMGNGQVHNPYGGHPGYGHPQYDFDDETYNTKPSEDAKIEMKRIEKYLLKVARESSEVDPEKKMQKAGHCEFNEVAQKELEGFEDILKIDQTPNHFIVTCKIRGQPIPPLRLVVPTTYPSGNVTVDRAAIDLDAYVYDDLQNVVHARLSSPELTTLSDYLNTWKEQVSQYMQQNPSISRDEPVFNFDDDIF